MNIELLDRLEQLEKQIELIGKKIYGDEYRWFPEKRKYIRRFEGESIDGKIIIKCPWCNIHHIYDNEGFVKCKNKNLYFYLYDKDNDSELLRELDEIEI